MRKGQIAVIGAGKWGQALHFALSFKQECFISSRTKKDIKNFVDLEYALSCEYLVIAIPAQEIRAWLKENFKFNNQKVLVASKGIEASSGEFLNDIYANFIPDKNIGFISGPSFAAEVIKALPCALVLNSKSKDIYDEFSKFFPDFIKTYYSKDVIGAEIAGAYKNVLAIASGICEGLNLGKNAQASLIARGLVEMQRFGKHFKAKKATFLGLSGAGDLFLTANSTMSRNYRVGLGLAQGKSLKLILEELKEVAEGVQTATAIEKLSNKYKIYTPIAKEVKLILDGKNPKDSLKDLIKN
ncbi:Glycerol-3-phosphate dehydrogenase [NAD(P)+] [Aliarcobacter thereius]|uniref:Glycerol-3-phosphate dehydrogenase [NAD(P)+] n=2 Tax=Aliarcobacter thereius TaxID=544718 RepID=A0A1C0BA26_9BACT|nr:NAD(P)H-dependent glycerol-3-phosphate dehydrogenase [Aliarcobacter thereius]OCL88414.1 Glycerol-3-phosphate dehydrogenase [NAD(P)+] [Aliarcobacter thereius]OCL91904.1 Glycerol-3-phosphate dehydrogenase [NAD(P)+] [Aliarcobacter thereius]OCL94998.1 Glycerol-3-phosphate dehydrogenase [NAD(P)+] [Aliarcobacter thereius LMG 24486]OCM00446.1 Glycerol-3-phosphate dehydrogenase [NAD(P)+] [Aliarcobacter thereius]QBF15131.1 glycerol-3-phosphate dehydrogenase [Aliarcobacter thereius LMG 24486]